MAAIYVRRFSVVLLLYFGSVTAGVCADSCAQPAAQAPLPKIALQEVANGISNPVHITHAGKPGRLYIVEQEGRIRVLDHGRLLDKPFLDIRDRVVNGGEKGLLSVAFHPDYDRNRQLYVDYTTGKRGLYTRIARFASVAVNKKGYTARRADPDSEEIVLSVEQPFTNHNGGQIAFGPDGYLYIGMGDGGWANDPWSHGQNLFTLLGALLRIDVDHHTQHEHYSVPADNPFVGHRDMRPEIWAYGLRNPWRFSFDRASGRLYLADVGQDAVEEIDVVDRGVNYGWNIMEGDICTPGVKENCDKANLALPVFVYRHPEGSSITGGFVYRGQEIAGLCGVYLYADYVTGKIWGLRYHGTQVTQHGLLLETPYNISSFGEDTAGELYIAAHRTGKILEIVAQRAVPQKSEPHM